MKVVALSFTNKGGALGDKVVGINSKDYIFSHIRNKEYPGGIKSFIKENWNNYQGFIFISATGIAVRYISPYIKEKTSDPAILVMDDMGRFIISLLSGHLGGANQLTSYLADKMNIQPIITTATDGRGIESVDMFAKKNNYIISDISSVTGVTSLMVNNKKVGIYTEDGRLIDYDNLVHIKDLSFIDKDIEGLIIVSSEKVNLDFNFPTTQLIPKNINIGIGCRRGMEKSKIKSALEGVLDRLNLLPEGIKQIGTIEVKKDEKGILDLANDYKLPVKIFSIDEVAKVEDMFEKSQFVKDTIGVFSVSEPVAYLLGGDLLTGKIKCNGITISVSKIKGEDNE